MPPAITRRAAPVTSGRRILGLVPARVGYADVRVVLRRYECVHVDGAVVTPLYVRMMNPKETRVTGSSRDATLWLEGGRPVARVPQFRFTRGETVFMESVVAPGAVAASFPVDVVTG